jgi:hypothetical protein
MHHHIQSIIDSIHFGESGTIYWLGEPYRVKQPDQFYNLSEKQQKEAQIQLIIQLLYENFYVHGEAYPSKDIPKTFGIGDLEAEFDAVITDESHWDESWEYVRTETNDHIIQKKGVQLRVDKKEARINSSGSIDVKSSRKKPHISPGYFSVIGSIGAESDQGITTRIYFNVSIQYATKFFQQLVEALDEALIPFFFKILSDASSYYRTDTAVLYINKESYASVASILLTRWDEIHPYLNQRTPAFTKEIAPGISVAEDPQLENKSFGEHRCMVIAKALVETEGLTTNSSIDVIRNISTQGEDLNTFWLNNNSTDVYHPLSIRPSQQSNNDSSKIIEQEDPLKICQRLGDRICREAIWDEEKCTWLMQNSETSLFSSLSDTLYDGVSGIVWYLAQLYQVTKQEKYRTTAIGGAVFLAQRLSVQKNHTFYQGLTGIIYVVSHVSKQCNAPELRPLILPFLKINERDLKGEKESDLLGGLAGTLVGLNFLVKEFPEAYNLEYQMKLIANEIENRVCIDHRGASWNSLSNDAHTHNLCGLSHGSIGVALALNELQQTFKVHNYTPLIQSALSYEEAWFVENNEKWPDLRFGENYVTTSTSFWCHGAPGIALARKSIYKDESIKQYPNLMKACIEEIHQELDSLNNEHSSNSFSVCHGITGNAWVLQLLEEFSGKRKKNTLRDIQQHASTTIESEGELNYGFFTGITGIGCFLLDIITGENRSKSLLLPIQSSENHVVSP